MVESRDVGVNPYAAPPIDQQPRSPNLEFAAWIAIACCVLSLGFWAITLVVSLPYGHPNAPPLWEILAYTITPMILPAIGLAGGISMIQKRRYGWAVIGACCMLVPAFGPCCGLTMPLGIWMLFLLRPSSVRESFAAVR